MKTFLISIISMSVYTLSVYGAALHIGNTTIPLSPNKLTSPSFCADINNETLYAPMHKSETCKFCAIYNGEKYNIGMIFLNYLYFDGASYIDLGFPPSANLQFEIKAYMDNSVPNHDGCLLGARNSDSPIRRGQYLVWYTNATNYCGGAPHILPAFDDREYIQIVVTDTPQTIRWYDNIFSVNDTVIENVLPTIKSPTTNNLALGAVQHDTTTDSRKFLGRVYYARFWHDDNLIMNLVPVIDVFGTPGFYDTVSKKLFYNSGTGQFKYNFE